MSHPKTGSPASLGKVMVVPIVMVKRFGRKQSWKSKRNHTVVSGELVFAVLSE